MAIHSDEALIEYPVLRDIEADLLLPVVIDVDFAEVAEGDRDVVSALEQGQVGNNQIDVTWSDDLFDDHSAFACCRTPDDGPVQVVDT